MARRKLTAEPETHREYRLDSTRRAINGPQKAARQARNKPNHPESAKGRSIPMRKESRMNRNAANLARTPTVRPRRTQNYQHKRPRGARVYELMMLRQYRPKWPEASGFCQMGARFASCILTLRPEMVWDWQKKGVLLEVPKSSKTAQFDGF